MSGWTGGWIEEPAQAGSSTKQSSNDAFDTSKMSAALPNNGDNTTHPQANDKPEGDAPGGQDGATAPGWAEPKQYDYGEYTTIGGEFDGNATVYHWDGEEGDLGPEFPQLEAELFGPPGRRDTPQGLDFTR